MYSKLFARRSPDCLFGIIQEIKQTVFLFVVGEIVRYQIISVSCKSMQFKLTDALGMKFCRSYLKDGPALKSWAGRTRWLRD